MNETCKVEAIILKRKPLKEFDCQVLLYSREKGKIDLVARGAKKTLSKIASHIEPLNFCEIMIVKGRRYDYIGSAISRRSHVNIKNDLDKLSAVGQAIVYFNELIKKEERDDNIFNLLLEFLSILNRKEPDLCDKKNGLVASFFLLKLVAMLGYKPETYHCVICKQKIERLNNRFYFGYGGLVCSDCHIELVNKKLPDNNNKIISEGIIKVLRFVMNNELKKSLRLKLDNNISKELNILTAKYIESIVNN